jgi:hypothetical protein
LIEGPPATRYVTDDTAAPDRSKSLPRLACARQRVLQRQHDDLRDLMHTITNRIIQAQQDRQHAAAVVQQRQHYGRGYIATAALEHARAELERAEQKLRACDEVLADLQQRAEQTKALLQPLSHVLRAIDGGVRNSSKITSAAPVVPRLRKGESHANCVDRLRVDLAKLAAERARVEAAPLPLQEALPLALAQLDELAERGKPNVWPLLEVGSAIQLATTPMRVDITGAVALPSDNHGHQLTGMGHGESIDAAGLLCWLFRNQMAKRIEAELRECCADSEPLSREDRAKRLAEIDVERLALEREEVACIEADGWRIPMRSDTSWLAALSVEG